jgi:tight adherence protein C
MVIEAMEKGQFVLYSAYALIGLGTFIVARMMMAESESRAVQENLEESRDRKASNRLIQITRPFFTQYIVPMVRGKPLWDNKRKIFKRKLISAGLKDELTADEFIAFKFFLILFFPIVGGLMNVLGLIDLNLIMLLGAGVGGYFYPNLMLSSRIAVRQKQILKSMPFIVDLLALSTEAGLDFIQAIGKVVEKAKPSPLVDEFSQLLKEIKVGSSRAEALREMSLRIDMSEVNSFVAILISADQMGASIGKILRQQSEQIRLERMVRAEKAGAAASQRVILPVVLFIVPSVMLLIFGPFIVGLVGGGGGF